MKNFQKFEALNEEKKTTIINASMREFLKGGYDKASMNDLVVAAGISKGSLFYYFDNKKTLYLYLFEYCQSLICETAERGIVTESHDFIERIANNIKENIRLLREYPLAYGFMKACKAEKSLKVKDEIDHLKSQQSDAIFSKLYDEIDHSLFKDDIDEEMAIYTIKTTMFQIVHDALATGRIKDHAVISKIDDYSTFYRTAFYR